MGRENNSNSCFAAKSQFVFLRKNPNSSFVVYKKRREQRRNTTIIEKSRRKCWISYQVYGEFVATLPLSCLNWNQTLLLYLIKKTLKRCETFAYRWLFSLNFGLWLILIAFWWRLIFLRHSISKKDEDLIFFCSRMSYRSGKYVLG